MAVVISNLATDFGNGTQSSFTTKSVNPPANTLILLTVCSRTGISTNPNQPTVTGEGLTWVAINSVVFDDTSSSRRRLTLFRAMGASPSAGALTIDFGGQNQTSFDAIWDQATGVNTSGTNGSGAIIQSATNFDDSATVSTLTVTLSAFTSSINATFGCFANGDGSKNPTAGSGFALLGTVADTGIDTKITSEWKATNDTTVDITWSGVGELGGIAVELNASVIAFDAVSDSGLIIGSSTATWSHTCTGSNGILFAGFFADTSDVVTGVTYNGVAMTFLGKVQVPSERWIYLYGLVNPATGAHNIVASASGSIVWRGFGSSYTGAAQTTPPDAVTTNSGVTVASLTTSLTTIADNCWTILIGKNGTAGAVAAGTGSTQRATSGSNGIAIFDSNAVITPPGSTSMQVTNSPNQSVAVVMASFAPVSTAISAFISRRLMTGVGI